MHGLQRWLFLLVAVLIGPPLQAAEPNRPNILFIAVDDLRTQLGCYGQPGMISPNIDRLAATGICFTRAYCMVPVCGASRASLLTGIRPTPNRFKRYDARADEDAPGVLTLNTHFTRNTYYSISNGKVFHLMADNASGWSEPPWRPNKAPNYVLPENQPAGSKNGKQSGGKAQRSPPYESADTDDATYADGQLADKTIADLGRLKRMNRPFFLAAGFFKPHLPFVAPETYWNLYALNQMHLPDNYFPPKDVPDAAMHKWTELRAYAGIPAHGPVADDMALTLIRGYYACVSYVDAQIGRVLDELRRLELEENTIVVLWGDHGWQLGEHTLWCKHCNFETSMRAPLIFRVPGIPGGRSTAGLTEFIDIYPSLCELAGIPKPDHLEGKSFVPLLRNPEQPWKKSAIGRFARGDTIRTSQYRYTEYRNPRGKTIARMLFDHDADPDENVNIAQMPGNGAIVEQLAEMLREVATTDEPMAPRKARPAGTAINK